MSDSFTRRGFTQAAIAGVAALCLPSLGRAQDALRLRPRWEWLSIPSQLTVRLHLKNEGERGVEVLANAITLKGRLHVNDQDRPVILSRRYQIRSRVWRPSPRLVTLPADREIEYGTFQAAWPEGWPSGGAELYLRAGVTQIQPTAEERRGYRILQRMTAHIHVARTA
jgi:hypothetical protein